jgi:hypothetical protein
MGLLKDFKERHNGVSWTELSPGGQRRIPYVCVPWGPKVGLWTHDGQHWTHSDFGGSRRKAASSTKRSSLPRRSRWADRQKNTEASGRGLPVRFLGGSVLRSRQGCRGMGFAMR